MPIGIYRGFTEVREFAARDGRAMESDPQTRGRPEGRHDLGFLSRDGGTRTRDLSVPNAAWSHCRGLGRTKSQAAPVGRTPIDVCDQRWTRDKRGMNRLGPARCADRRVGSSTSGLPTRLVAVAIQKSPVSGPSTVATNEPYTARSNRAWTEHRRHNEQRSENRCRLRPR
jgi:hypothetical protein